jgi:hypothetical protein
LIASTMLRFSTTPLTSAIMFEDQPASGVVTRLPFTQLVLYRSPSPRKCPNSWAAVQLKSSAFLNSPTR